MTKTLVCCVLAVLAFVAAQSVDAEVYQCTDATGRKIFQGTPCAEGQKTVSTGPSDSSNKKLKDGIWEISSQKFSGNPSVQRGAPKVMRRCVRDGFLTDLDTLNRQIFESIGADCKERTKKLTSNTLRGSYSCSLGGASIEMHYEMIFDGELMYGTIESQAIGNGTVQKDRYKHSGKWLKAC